MNSFPSHRRQLSALRLNLPLALLVTLLQRTPVLRVIATAEEMIVAPSIGAVLKAGVSGIRR